MEQLLEESINNRYSCWVREALDELPQSFAITDPEIPGHPIVFASTQLLKMFGYSRHEVIGRNISLFQGVATNRTSLLDIRHAVRDETNILIPSLLNYHKNGTPFWILFRMFPVFGVQDGKLVHFVALQVPIFPPRSTTLLGFCRREVICSDTVPTRISNLSPDDGNNTELTDTTCKASELEKCGADSAMTSILSLLTHYSQLTGRLVSGQRCCSSYMNRVGVSLNISLGRIKQSFVLVDPHKTDNPIVYASDAFLDLTGYTRHEVLGRNCRFLSGQETDVSIQSQKRWEFILECFAHVTCPECFWQSYIVEVHMEVTHDIQNLSVEIMQLSVVGAVKIAVRSSGMIASTSD
uniref:protein TWIN LOV 1 isoform X2 n=1 Tax=Erigeron canadensis TaxID=72917 RepID=UPI001CB94B62|nr:protein TWIN LOV 1 isoform X2 [Erigeron canadensis]